MQAHDNQITLSVRRTKSEIGAVDEIIGDVLVESGSVGACHGVELSLLLFVIGGKFTVLILKNQEKLKLKIHFLKKHRTSCLIGMTTNDLRFCCLVLTGFSRYDMHFILERSESAAYQRERFILQHRFGITDKDKRLKDVLLEMVKKEI